VKEEFVTAIRMVSVSMASPGITRPETAPDVTTRDEDSMEPPYKVILHNDDFTPMEHVIATLRKVIPRMSMKQAAEIMLEAHKNGKAVVIKCHKELAELYEESLRNEGLVATIEPD
jgi:ATP-dependent Clp protease adaptor protein ClpS